MQTRICCTCSSAQLISKITTVAILSTGEPYGILHYLTERAATETVDVKTAHSKKKKKKKLLLKRALSDIHLPGRAPTEAIKTGPSKEKLLPKRALSDIYLTERAATVAVDVKTAHSKRNCC